MSFKSFLPTNLLILCVWSSYWKAIIHFRHHNTIFRNPSRDDPNNFVRYSFGQNSYVCIKNTGTPPKIAIMNTLVNIHDSFIVDGASARENVSPQKGISGTPMSFEYQRMSAFIKNMHPREEIIYVGMKSLAFNFLTKSQARSE